MKWLDPNNPFDNSYYGEKRPSTWKIILCGFRSLYRLSLMFESYKNSFLLGNPHLYWYNGVARTSSEACSQHA